MEDEPNAIATARKIEAKHLLTIVAPVSTEPAASFYPKRHTELNAAYQSALRRSKLLDRALTIAVGLTAFTVIQFLRGALPITPLLVGFFILIAVAYFLLGAKRKRDRLLRMVLHYDRALERYTGTNVQSGNTGLDFRTEDHRYDHDLSILGTHSLFGALDSVRTGVGQWGLAELLLGNRGQTRETILAHRAAVQELTTRNDLRESIAMLGETRFQQVSAAYLDRWIDNTPAVFPSWVRISLCCTTSIILITALLGIAHVLPWDTLRPALFLTFAVQGSIALSVRKRVLPLLDKSSHLASQMGLFRDALTLLNLQNFTAPKLQELQGATATPRGAIGLLNKLQGHFTVVEQRSKEWFLIPSLIFCAGTHAAMSIATWKRDNAVAMKQWMAVWADFEALSAVATFAYEHPDYIYPEVLEDGTAVFEATALTHPLLSPEAVANNIELNEQTRLYLISGSNMAGKSTLMRSIGVNVVLANAGAPIRATAARISPFVLGASIALTDSLAEGRSKFLAEVERLQSILQAARNEDTQQRVLFLIDEIFSGTNSLDRKLAAEAVVRELLRHGAIGALSTHDITITEMADAPALHAVNVHMASPDADDPLAFDYILKPGINQSSNALAIVRMIGVDV
jgi:hypothetical protein